jgi:HD-GYP domain-containing protein (c-di-GMP phosphodiesterase class II)
VASIVRHHHERYDGQGYPDGVKGDAIPMFSRILFILDAYEALATDRIYRKGMGKEKALEEIAKNAGSQFDPRLVKVFLEAMDEEDDVVNSVEGNGKPASLKQNLQ